MENNSYDELDSAQIASTGGTSFTSSTVCNLRFPGQYFDAETGLHYNFHRYYDPALGRYITEDPIRDGLNWYAYAGSNPGNNVDPLGLEPTRSQAGTIGGLKGGIDSSPSKIGRKTGSNAASAMISLGATSWGAPITTPYFNNQSNRYVYTGKGGWIDMVHFLFYAGKAYEYKTNGKKCPDGEALQVGYQQEFSDQLKAPHSAYSYEDLPSDKYGADFGANHFDPKSSKALSDQIQDYLMGMGATAPTSAPNYSKMPWLGSDVPSTINKTTSPMFTKP